MSDSSPLERAFGPFGNAMGAFNVTLPPWMEDLLGEVGVPTRAPLAGRRSGVETASTSNRVDPDLGDVAHLVMAELTELDRPAPSGALWHLRRRILPPQLLAFLTAAVRVEFVREVVLAAAEDELLAGVDPRLHDVALIEALWRATCLRGRAPQTLSWLRCIRDRVVRSFHSGSCYQHTTFTTMSPLLKRWRPRNGALVIDEGGGTGPSLGYAPFLERTPRQLIRYVYETWRARKLKSAHAFEFGIPTAWDLFAGSGTGTDVLAGILGCQVIATDLNPCNEAIATLDARAAGTTYEHGGRKLPRAEETDNRVVANPDIVLLDPPSRGTPTHTSVYGGDREHADMSTFDRKEWTDTVVETIQRVLPRLARARGRKLAHPARNPRQSTRRAGRTSCEGLGLSARA